MKSPVVVRKWAFVVLASISFLLPSGCGEGRVTQDDMRKFARRSTKKSDDPESQPVAEKVKQPATAEVVAQSANTAANPAQTDEAPQPAPQPTATTSAINTADTVPATMAPPTTMTGIDATQPPVPMPSGPTKPAQPLTLPERRQRTIDNLTAIAAALKKYTDKNGRLLFPAISDAASRPLLSWRVELLPYLGYQQLYDQFHLNEPWNSPHNQALLAAIPAEYQSQNALIPRQTM